MTIRAMLEAHPGPTIGDLDALVRCIESCGECAAACPAAPTLTSARPSVQDLVRCIRSCLDCADVCDATGRIVTRQTASDVGVVRAALESCLVACRACRAECERHAKHHEHCRICAEVCSRCEQACEGLLASIG